MMREKGSGVRCGKQSVSDVAIGPTDEELNCVSQTVFQEMLTCVSRSKKFGNLCFCYLSAGNAPCIRFTQGADKSCIKGTR
jgi:hypothetical protein